MRLTPIRIVLLLGFVILPAIALISLLFQPQRIAPATIPTVAVQPTAVPTATSSPTPATPTHTAEEQAYLEAITAHAAALAKDVDHFKALTLLVDKTNVEWARDTEQTARRIEAAAQTVPSPPASYVANHQRYMEALEHYQRMVGFFIAAVGANNAQLAETAGLEAYQGDQALNEFRHGLGE